MVIAGIPCNGEAGNNTTGTRGLTNRKSHLIIEFTEIVRELDRLQSHQALQNIKNMIMSTGEPQNTILDNVRAQCKMNNKKNLYILLENVLPDRKGGARQSTVKELTKSMAMANTDGQDKRAKKNDWVCLQF